VTPFAGNGANMALSDGWDLATFLCSSRSVAEAIKRYDALVVPRSTKVWKQSHQNINVGHATGLKSRFLMWLFRIVFFLFFRGQGNMTTESEEPTAGQS